ncbi:sporulation transcriptional regulator SpoIIID [Caldicellulosiruptor naganoensis]|uniref:Sporulation transcriptional regulator SpoIIID n=1 Tax=Caldicellulosiruptor naganoensis TaxID=29324 RepID=A0ABY7BIJ8_9FIRM|nr:sporulation transcriptional regulator SpoIIID [Caldicellulosiruptor naganoensis]WAM32663.1 sporulation transcriptional regulator SpoIIID [Caldicellulosiruptor naganoensis]
MKEDIEKRAILAAELLIKYNATVRKVAKILGISKSTVRNDLTWRLYKINKRLYKEVRTILDRNKQERHIRGGEATKKKYFAKKEKASLKNSGII